MAPEKDFLIKFCSKFAVEIVIYMNGQEGKTRRERERESLGRGI